MIIYSKSGSIILDIEVDDTSYRYRAIRQGDKVYLYFSLTDHVEIPTYSYITFQGQRYTLWKPENLTKKGERNLEYVVEFGGYWEILNRTKFKFLSGKPYKLKFPLTAKPGMFMQLVIDNLNLHDSGWTLGTCIEAPEKAMTFNHETCMEVVNRLADEFNTEIEFINKTINFGKVERFKNNPLPLSYGKGNGFKTGVGRKIQGDKAPVTVLYVQGGERNIDSSKYGSTSLLLPKSQELEFQGRRYRTDEDGMFIIRADRTLTNHSDDSYDASDIYPSRVGEVTGVETEVGIDSQGNSVTFYNIVDNTIPQSLNYRDCRIPGEKATIIFQTGILTGKEFDIFQTDKDLTGYDHENRTFKLSPLNTDGATLPNENLKPSIGDKYAVYNITLPEVYVCDNPSKTGASWDMFREAVRYMFENEEERFTFSGELDGIWAKSKWLEIGGKLQPGSYILFNDTQFQPEGLPIRITGVKDYINKPHSPELELSNTPVAGFVSSELGKIEENEVKDEERHNSVISFTKRRWRDAKETLEMLSNALLNFSGSINPISVHTMMLLLGDESLQYRFVNNKTNPSQIGHVITYDTANKILNVPAGIIQHMTLGIKDISSAHKVSDYKFWTLPALNYAVEGTEAYYLYAKVSKTSETGMFILSKTAIGMQDVAGYYHLLVGVLNSEFDNERSFVELYGFTEILPGRITTDRVVSSDGQNFLDFVNNAFRVGSANSYIDYNTQGDGKLHIKGIIVQSDSGTDSFIGCFRGPFNSTYTYYPGDEVTYDNGAYISTYRYKYPTSSKGILPTNTEYWEVVAQGGLGIKETDVLYAISTSNTLAPANGWQTDAPAWINGKYIWSKTKVTYTDGSIKFTEAACITGGKGETGNGISSIVEQYYLSSSATSLSGGSWSTTRPTWRDGWYIWTRSVITYTAGNQVTTLAICVTGGKGETGEDGSFFEYRYAVNGSRTSPPTLSKTSVYPAGWTTEMPSVGALQYMWCTVAKKNATGSLVTYWSTPTRITGYDGIDGKDGAVGPALTYQGIYDISKRYFGTAKRVDAVKYNGIYYVARVDAGNGFSGKVPTDATYWNEFGNQFDNVATNLLLAENASIGSWWHSGGKIVSTLNDGNKITLDASVAQIIIESARSGGEHSMDNTQGSIIKLDAQQGLIEARSKKNSRVASISPAGIFSNNAEIDAMPTSTGITQRAAIVGLGNSSVNKSDWAMNADETIVAGVYGRASNSGTAPAYGGFFYNLRALGASFGVRYITDNSDYNTRRISPNNCIVISLSNRDIRPVVYLPNDGVEGRIVIVKQMGQGSIRVDTLSGQYLYDDSTENEYFDLESGTIGVFIFGKWSINTVYKEIWSANFFSW